MIPVPSRAQRRARSLALPLAGLVLIPGLCRLHGADSVPAAAPTPPPAPASAAAPATQPGTGSIPYLTIADVYDGFAKTKQKDKLRVAVRITPAQGHVLSPPLTVEIRSREATLPIQLSPTGELLNFPLTAALRTENPRIVSNQPKGSLALQAELAIRYPGRLEEYAAWYLDALAQANAAVNEQAGLLKHLTPRLKTLVFHFTPTGSPASIRLHTEDGDKTFSTDAEGRVRIQLGPDSARRTAHLVLPSEPLRITAE